MLRREAARWFARLESGRDPDIDRKFRRWQDADPAHAEAFQRVQKSYGQAGLLRQSPAFSDRSLTGPSRPVSSSPRYAWAAAAALVIAIPAAWLAFGHGLFVRGTDAMMLATGVGEIKHIGLSDGSKLTLDTATSVEVEIGQARRRALLKRGRARLEVASGREPFVLETGSATVTTSGSVVDIQRAGDSSRVDVLSGNAIVQASNSMEAAGVALRGGQSVAARTGEGLVQQSGTPPTDWVRGMLQFDRTPLEAAVAQANGYSKEKILLSGDFADLHISGAFRAGDTARLAKALAVTFDLSLGRSTDGNWTLSRVNRRPQSAGG